MAIAQFPDKRVTTLLSGDVKPTTGIRQGDYCEEIDTSKLFQYNGSAWVEKIPKISSASTEVIFHTTATVAANGTPFTVGTYKTLTVEIYGTSTSRTVTFYGKSKSGTLRAIQGVRLSDFTLAASTTGTAEMWQFDITGLDTVTMDLTAVAGGNVSIAGNAVT